MLNTSPIAVLWDDSHIWGLMALRALRDLDFPVRLLKGSDIAQGALFRKQGSAAGPAVSLLVVPGGSARLKAEGLGPEGQQAVRDFVQAGGRYLGFCGGAGLALSHNKGLGLCPWGRASYPERILHLISGHVRATISPSPFTPRWDSPEASLPVWWPGRFGNVGGDVDVLARYKAPDTDFWIADLPLSSVPSHAFRDWLALYGVNLSADFLTSSELIVHGGYGHGEYILSYSHLETPESPQANQWLCRILSLFTGATLKDRDISPWNLFSTPAASDSAPCDVEKAFRDMLDIMELAIEHRLFFKRTSWLTCWKPGLPGIMCNNLLASFHAALSLPRTGEALAFWEERRKEFTQLCGEFFPGAESYLLAARLAETLRPTMPGAIDRDSLIRERDRLFGHPMAGGGVLGTIQSLIDEYIYLCHRH